MPVKVCIKRDPELLSYWHNWYIRSTAPIVLPCHPRLVRNKERRKWKRPSEEKKGLMRSTDFTLTHFKYICSHLDMQSTLVLVFWLQQHWTWSHSVTCMFAPQNSEQWWITLGFSIIDSLNIIFGYTDFLILCYILD